MRKIIILGFVICVPYFVNAQTVAFYDSLLTSGKEQQWECINHIFTLGGSNCDDGSMILTFSLKYKNVLIKKCVNREWEEERLSWKIVKDSESTFYLVMGEDEREIDFFEPNNIAGELMMRLRSKISEVKTEAVMTQIFEKN